jgi:hypothetical protein
MARLPSVSGRRHTVQVRGGSWRSDRPVDILISYSPADERWATWIAWLLETNGYRTMLQAWDFVPGTKFIDFMDRGISEAQLVVALLSRAYLSSTYGRMEWQAALRAAPENPATKLMTVRVEECPAGGAARDDHICGPGRRPRPGRGALLAACPAAAGARWPRPTRDPTGLPGQRNRRPRRWVRHHRLGLQHPTARSVRGAAAQPASSTSGTKAHRIRLMRFIDADAVTPRLGTAT